MIRVLVLIAVSGFVLSVATLSAAVAIGGPEALSHAAWTWGANRDWGGGGRHGGWSRWADDEMGEMDGMGSDAGPQTTRDLAWTGGDSLDVEVPAEVRYTQAPGPAKLTITGPKRSVDDIEVKNGHISFDDRRHHEGGKLTIVMTAPDIRRFDLHGSSSLAIAGYKQDRLTIDLSGNADVSAVGEVGVLDLEISGSADADLGKLKAKGGEIRISGSGAATVAPSDWAKVDISGSGDVTLLTTPPKLETNVSGSGSIHQGRSEADAAPVAPAPPPSKSAKRL